MSLKKKKMILTIIAIILLIFVLYLSYLLINKYVLKKNFENTVFSFADKNKETIFKIDEILLFSNCDVKNKNIASSNFTIENLYQFTDIALFFDNSSEEKNLENTFKKVYINNINFYAPPAAGEPKLYFKSLSNFAKSDIIDENVINEKLEFNISSEDETDLNKATLYNNLANPITLSYVNSNIKTDYTILDTTVPITYDGSLLQRCNVNLQDIACKVSFDIYIVNNLDQEFKCSIFLDIPLEDSNGNSIYNGGFSIRKDTNFNFYRYK